MRNVMWGLFFAVTVGLAATAAWGADAEDENVDNAAQSGPAKERFEQAAKQAKEEDKNLLVTFGAPYCGACRHFKALMARPELKQLISKDYVPIYIDLEEDMDGQSIYHTYRMGKGGIPWTIAVDVKGKVLAQFVGYPAGDDGVDQFVKMLDEHGDELSPEQLASIKNILQNKPSQPQTSSQSAPTKEGKPTVEKQPETTKKPKPDNRKYKLISAPAPSGRVR